mmetsp:Transcript_24469/g.37941  ORF Transcript_24469/g.37941 Transcript_24469/m.37941 type:complete len:267 (+) Transcript_24469:1094-1894(+)
MNTMQQLVYTLTLLPALAEAIYRCNLRIVPPTCHQHTQALGLNSVRPERRLLFTFDAGEALAKLGVTGEVFGTFGLLAPDFLYNDSCTKVAKHSMLIGTILSVIVYYTMISKRRQSIRTIKKMTIAGSIIALLLLTPYIYFDVMDIKQSAVRQPFAMSVIMITFRVIEAAFGFAPEGVTTSLGMYMIYFACSGCEFIFDAKTSKPVKASAYDIFQSLWRLLRVGIINTLFFSYLAHFDYMPFGHDRTHYLDPNHLGNCFCIARECI